MTEEKQTSGADLIAGIVKGQVPRQVRLFAAQGLLPVSREELLSLQCVLSSDPDEELAKLADDSLRGEEEQTSEGVSRSGLHGRVSDLGSLSRSGSVVGDPDRHPGAGLL